MKSNPFDVMYFIQSAQCIANDMIGTTVVLIKFHESLFVSEEVEEGESISFSRSGLRYVGRRWAGR